MALSKLEISQDFSLERLILLLSWRNVVLRHDVDFNPACALKMAKLEKEIGVYSTFYILPLDSYEEPEEALRVFEQIDGLGHELGVHVDLGLNRRSIIPDGYLIVCCEADFLSLSADLPVTRKVSFHAPPANALWRDVKGFEHAMAAEWSGRYVADSRGSWTRTPEGLLKTARPTRPVMLNLHSEWWFLSPYDREILRQREAVAP